MSQFSTTEKALKMLRNLPRVSLANIRDNPGSRQGVSFPQGDHIYNPTKSSVISRANAVGLNTEVTNTGQATRDPANDRTTCD